MVDDLDNSVTEDVLTCVIGLGEGLREIDLGPDNREELEGFLAKYIEAGRPLRPVKAARRQTKPARSGTDRERTHQIRLWAKGQGLQVSERGRISKDIQDAYDAAH